MRNKKAKALRRIAQFKTKGWPDRQYMVQAVIHLGIDRTKSKRAKGRLTDPGEIKEGVLFGERYNPDSIRLINRCTRYVYQKLKKAI